MGAMPYIGVFGIPLKSLFLIININVFSWLAWPPQARRDQGPCVQICKKKNRIGRL
jgi:hypothetical protein